MTYKTVVVGLGLDRSNDACLEVAGQLVKRFGAHAIGVAAGELTPPPYFTTGDEAQQVLDRSRAAVRNRIAEVEAQFRAAMQSQGLAAVEWRSSEDFPTRFVVRQARAADIIVVGEAASDAFANPFGQVNLSDVLLQAGRPLLVVPDSVSWLDLRSVLIAWKDTAECRRAVSDALPLLCEARDVTVTEIVEEDADQTAALSGTQDLVAWLSRHGVLASARVSCERGAAAAQLEMIASELDAGLVVAGAYGHSRFREWILGGVTKQLLGPSRRCSLLSR